MTTSGVVRAGVVGLGSMGLGMAQAALRSGLNVIGCDINPDSVARLVEAGGEAAASPRDMAGRIDVLAVLVVNAAQAEAVLFGHDGAAPAMRPGATLVVCVTMAPSDARRLAAMAEAFGLHYLDAPVSGGAARAASGELTFMASGSEAAFAGAQALLDAMGSTVYRLGNQAGVGSSYKIVNQLLAGIHIAAACEAMTFASRLGLDLDTIYKIITASAGNSWMFENRVPHILDGDYSTRSAVDIFTKDLGIVSDIGRAEKFPLGLGSQALQMFIATAAAGMGGDDDASVARMIAATTGVALPARSA